MSGGGGDEEDNDVEVKDNDELDTASGVRDTKVESVEVVSDNSEDDVVP